MMYLLFNLVISSLLLIFLLSRLRNVDTLDYTLKYFYFLIIINAILFYFIPSIFEFFTNGGEISRLNVRSEELSLVYIIEISSMFVWVLIVDRLMKYRLIPRNDFIAREFRVVKGLVIIGGALIILREVLLIPLESFGYFKLFIPFFIKAAPIASVVYLTIIPKDKILLNRVGLLVLVIVIFLSVLLTGSRGSLFSYALYYFFITYFINKQRKGVLLVGGVVIFLLLFSQVMHSYRRVLDSKDSISLSDRIENISASTEKDSERNSLEEIHFRLGINGNVSVGFLRMRKEGNSPGIVPVSNTVESVNPFSNSDKWSGSVDGTRYGMGMYLIHKKMTGRSANMSGFFTSMHGYWEFGLIGVIVFTLLSALYIGLVLNYAKSYRVLSIVLVILIFDTWWQMPKLWSYEIIISLFTLFLPFLFFINILKFLARLKFQK